MSTKNNRLRGKDNERYLAKRMRGERKGIMGGEDISTDQWSIEAKSFTRFAGEKIMQQAERNAPEGKTPLAVVHLKNQNHNKDIVMIRLKDWEEWYGKLYSEEKV